MAPNVKWGAVPSAKGADGKMARTPPAGSKGKGNERACNAKGAGPSAKGTGGKRARTPPPGSIRERENERASSAGDTDAEEVHASLRHVTAVGGVGE